MNKLSKEFISSIPKTINNNSCWIPNCKTDTNWYVRIRISGRKYSLHRIVMCLYYNINYDNKKIVARHSTGCDEACFNPDHIKPGTDSDNAYDRVRDGNHYNANKKVCPRCGFKYKITVNKTGDNKGKIRRTCIICTNRHRHERKLDK